MHICHLRFLFCAGQIPNKSRRSDRQHEQKRTVNDDVLINRRKEGRVGFQKPDDNAADNRSFQRAVAADDDAGKRFGLEADEYTGATRIIILKLKDQSMIGVIVDEVKEVVNLDPETIEKPNFKLDESNASYLTGIGKSGENLISLLNIENVVGETKTA